MKKLITLMTIIFCSMSLRANELDLSGTWQLHASITEDDVPYTSVLQFASTSSSSEFGGALYDVTGNLNGIKVKTASIEMVNGERHLVWWLLRDDGIDLESNLILHTTPDSISLGGDFERYEVATMKRLPESATQK